MTLPPEAQAPPPSMSHLPDADTAEAILYGDAYVWIKSALWAWDEMEDYLLRKKESLLGQIQDRRFAYEVLTRNRYVIFSKSPRFNSPQQNQDVFTLREIIKTASAIQRIRECRGVNISWARMQGIRNYVGSLRGRGFTEAEWKAATSDYNMDPITYDSVHGASPETMPEEDIDWDEFVRALLGEDEYSELVETALGGGGPAWEGAEEDGEGWEEGGEDPGGGPGTGGGEDGEEDGPEPGGEDGEEPGEDGGEGEEEPADPFGLLPAEDLEALFGDPVLDAVAAVESLGGECSEAAEVWAELGSDGRHAVDMLIGMAEAVV